MKLRPLHDKLAILPEPPESKTRGGLFIPERHQEDNAFAKVIAVGPGRHIRGELRPLEVKAGDRILFEKRHYRASDEIEFEDERLIIISEEQVLAILTEEP